MYENKSSETLYEKGFITEAQLQSVQEYRSRRIFSIRNEANLFFFISVMLFTGGVGIFIYKHIDTIGHMAILAIILAVTLVCYYYSIRHSKGFSREMVVSEKPLYDYLVLSASLLTGIFVGYLQFQYSVFGAHNDFATLLVATIYFFCAYYFDHKGVLSLAIAALCTFIGFSAGPKGLMDSHFEDRALAIYAMITAIVLILAGLSSQRSVFKPHFNEVYENFGMHIFCVAAISQLFYPLWFVSFLVLAAGVFYFIRLSFRKHSAYFFSFSFLYGFTGLTIFLGRVFVSIHMNDEIMAFFTLTPFYFVGAIVAFVISLKRVKKTDHDRLQ